MATLQHLALGAYIDSGARYDGNNMVIENVIFEIDQLKDQMIAEIDDLNEEYAFLQKIKNKEATKNISEKFDELVLKISSKLFDSFSYSDVIGTDEAVDWKEYLHSVYDCVVPEEKTPYNHRVWEILPEQPKELAHDSPCWAIVNDIKESFEKLKAEGCTLGDTLEVQKSMGKELVSLKNQIVAKNKILDVYYRILNWSMN